MPDEPSKNDEATGPQPEQESDRQAQPVDSEQPPRLAFPVVGIGASAGGLEAFTEFFKAMPPDSGLAFVVIQHLPPDRESMISEILSRHTKMTVQEVKDGVKIAPNHVYVIRPGHTLTIKNGRLHLAENVDQPRHGRPVDDFFKSLADEQRERAICIIMSGMGSNGAAGAQTIKAVGGVCIAQDPDSAQFPSMPRHLIDAGHSDYILRPADMPEVLIDYARHPYAKERGTGEPVLHREQQNLREILNVLRVRVRHDFSGYKKPTILRRIQRRMGLNRVTDIADYAKLLRQNPLEVSALADDLLIHVTGFFRDADAWEALRSRVIVPLVADREPDGEIRCWVTACSSGEEAYTLAILLVEECERAGKALSIKIFATDTADRTLGNARNGVYPGGIEAEMSPERLERFFQKEDAVYRVRQDLRERVVFASQNVLQDPPFSRLDIATCRNLLIYLEPDVQQRVLSVLHFGLREGGMLFLGTSETTAGNDDLFQPVDKKARIFRRIGMTRHGAVEFSLPRRMAPPVAETFQVEGPRVAARPTLAQLTARALLARHTPAAVTVDRERRVVYFQGDTGSYLSQPSGEPSRDVLVLAAEHVRGAVRSALQRAMAQNKVEQVLDGWVEVEGTRRRVVVTASPLEEKEAPEYFVISFEQRDDADLEDRPRSGDPSGLAAELQRVRIELRSTIEELQAANEEHKASAEEIMSVNEELQSSNEELETSKEEMQSLNEELTTVNTQLQAKIDEYQKVSNDLSALLSSTDIAVIFLDPHFRIRSFTAASRQLLGLLGSDVGRPLGHLVNKFTDPDLHGDAQVVLKNLMPIEREISAHDGRSYSRKILPYRTLDNRIDGVVITFVEVTEARRASEVVRQSEERLATKRKFWPAYMTSHSPS